MTGQQFADVVVVGYGAAGVCAALEAHARGADVVAIDRFNGGGATQVSGGSSMPVVEPGFNARRGSTTAPKRCSPICALRSATL